MAETGQTERRQGPMGGPHGAAMAGEKARDFKGTMKKLRRFSERRQRRYSTGLSAKCREEAASTLPKSARY